MSRNKVDYYIDFDINKGEEMDSNAGEKPRTDTAPPPPMPELEIVPHEPGVEELEDERGMVQDILRRGGKLPWIDRRRRPSLPN